MEQGTVVACPVKVGDFVRTGQPILEIETDKATMELESPDDGYVKAVLVQLGQTVPVGTSVVLLAEKDEQIPAETLEKIKASQTALSQMDTEAATAEPIEHAEELRDDDLVTAVQQEQVYQPDKLKLGQTVPMTKFQKITAERMLHSKRQIPCFYLNVQADFTELAALRERLNESSQVRVSYNDFIIRALADALAKNPLMTGRLEQDNIVLADKLNVAFAVAVADGVITPVIKDVAGKNLADIATQRAALAEKARGNQLHIEDLEGACITISNLGSYGVDSFIPIVPPNQAAILGLGRIKDIPVPQGGDFTVRKVMNMTLSVDHRIVNGAYAAEFLDSLRFILEAADSF